MPKTWLLLPTCALSLLAACSDKPSPDEAAARQAEAIEARSDPEAARLIEAADSVRAAGRAADSLASRTATSPSH